MPRGSVLVALLILSSAWLSACGEAAPAPGPVVVPGAPGGSTTSTPGAEGAWEEPCESNNDCSVGGTTCQNGICAPRNSSGNGNKAGSDDGWQPAGSGGSGGSTGSGSSGGTGATTGSG